MKGFLFILLIAFFGLFTTETRSAAIDRVVDKERSLADLSMEEKKEAIAYILSTGDCSYNGIKLYGKVQIVESFPDIKVQMVNSFPDIKVKWVDAFPNDCGEWKLVSSFPDFKIQLVDAFPDLKMQEVDAFPGMN